MLECVVTRDGDRGQGFGRRCVAAAIERARARDCFFWDAIPTALYFLLNGFSLEGTPPSWLYVLTQCSPSSAYVAALVSVLPEVPEVARQSVGGAGYGAGYATPAIGFAILALWLVGSIAVGYYRFDRADL